MASEAREGGVRDALPNNDAREAGGDGAPLVAPTLPIVILTVPGRAIDKLADDKAAGHVRIVEPHDTTVLRADGQLDPAALAQAPASLDVAMGVSLHGALSRTFAQKSFAVELRDDKGMDLEEKVLGMPSDADWVLVACWSDKTCMRNPLAYQLGRQIGPWQPRNRFVEVMYNDQYQGIYMLVEPIRHGKQRVDIPKPVGDPAMGMEAFTGGYIFRREAEGKGGARDWISPVKDPHGVPIAYTYHYPRDTAMTTAQKNYLRDHVAAFERVMYGPDWADPVNGYRAWLDLDGAADMFLMQEISNNVDAYFKSLYFQKLPDAGGARGKIRMGPFWDFNFAFGNADYLDGWKPTSWAINRGLNTGFCSARLPTPTGCAKCEQNTNETCNPCTACYNVPWQPSWIRKLWTDPAFQSTVACRWKKLRPTAFTDASVDEWLSRWQAELRPNVARHFTRWPDLRKKSNANPCDYDATARIFKKNTRFTVPGLPDPNCGARELSHEEFLDYETNWLRAWTHARLAFLDTSLLPLCKP